MGHRSLADKALPAELKGLAQAKIIKKISDSISAY